jgi:isopentenyl-diphosphate delta-isomerase
MSQDELVDIIDEQGNVLKVVEKRLAHTEGLLHKCVISQVIDKDGRWLLVLQSKGKQYPGQYVSAIGGHITSGETEDEALKKEAFEELGLTGDIKFEYVDRAIFNTEVIGRKENHLFIMYKIHSDAQPVLNDESDSWKYFTEAELKSELKNYPEKFGNAFHFCIQKFFPELQ